MAKKQEVRWHKLDVARGELWMAARYMTEAEGWVMVRHKGCSPFLVLKAIWDDWERTDPTAPAEG
jgi:hypothetical protein